jgi:Mrp family chromosome partitioning ATPase
MDPRDNPAAKPTLADYIAPIWRHKWIVLTLALAVAAATYVFYDHKPPEYRAETEIYVKSAGAEALIGNAQPAATDREIANQARVVRSRLVAQRVARRVGFKGDPNALLNSIDVFADPQADFVTVQAVGHTPREAAALANGFAQAFVEQRTAQRRADADRALVAARGALASLRSSPTSQTAADQRTDEQDLASQISQLEILRSLPTGSAEQLDPAEPPSAPFAPKPARNAVFAFVMALALAIFAAFGLDRMDRRIRQLDEVPPIYDAPVIATIPRSGERPPRMPPAVIPPSLLEPFRTLRTALGLDDAAKTILVTSAVPREGKSTVVRNLALAYREAGKRVLVLEADLRKPELSRSLFTLAEPGLTDVLQSKTRLSEALHAVPTDSAELRAASPRNGHASSGAGIDGEDVMLLPAGTPAIDPPTLLGADLFKILLREVRERFDVVLIDSPPLLSVSDALPVLPEVDGVLLVSRVGTTTEESAKELTHLVGRVRGTRLLGVVANGVPAGVRTFNYGMSEYAAPQ